MSRRTLRAVIEVLGRGLAAALDIMAPRRARTMRTSARNFADIPIFPETRELEGVRIVTLARYREPAVEDLIRSLKYDGSHAAAQLAAALLADYLREEIGSLRLFSPRPILLVPVPLHRKRERERGFNQMERVLAKLPRDLSDGALSRVVPRLLVRTRETPAQTRLPRRKRLHNPLDAFAVSDALMAAGAHAILVDDVATSGATLLHAGRALEEAGATVTRLALARA